MSTSLYEPAQCRHGVPPTVECEAVETGLSATFNDTVPGRMSVHYECRTPIECWQAEADRHAAMATG